MNRYGKLLNWEINRFVKLYVVLWVLTLLSQFVGLLLYIRHFMNHVTAVMQLSSMTPAEYVAKYSPATFSNYTASSWFTLPIALCAATLLLYVFLIWYREWIGKGTFIYRLLMLPTVRMNVYLAKMSAILLFVLGLVAFQVLILLPEMHLFNSMIPSDLRTSVSLATLLQNQSSLLNILLPHYLIQFLLSYGAGLMGIVVLFTAILLERSFKLKGIVAGVIYGGISGFVFLLPVLISSFWVPNYFYPSQVVQMEVLVGLVVTGGSLWLSSYLLRNRITV